MRYIAITGVALFSLLLGTIVGYYTNIEVPEIVVHWPDRKANEYSPSYNGETGDEVAFIFIGSSKCQYANDERVNRIVRRAKLHLSRLIEVIGSCDPVHWNVRGTQGLLSTIVSVLPDLSARNEFSIRSVVPSSTHRFIQWIGFSH